MLEILLIVMLVKKVGRMLRDKGRSPGAYQAMVVLLWIAGEIAGVVVGVALDLGMAAYALALVGAGAGALSSYLIVNGVRPAVPRLYDGGRPMLP